MAQNLLYDPIKLKTGDKVFVLVTGDPASNLRPNIKIVRFTVIEKHETLSRIDMERAKRNFRFKLQSELQFRQPKTPGDDARTVEVDDSAALFKTFDGCLQHLDAKKEEWRESLKGHDDRQKRLAGTLYQTIPVEPV